MPYKIETQITNISYYLGSSFDYIIKAHWTSNEFIQINFPYDIEFHQFELIGSRQESAKHFYSNAVIEQILFVYRLMPKVTGNLSIPSVTIEIKNTRNNKVIDYYKTVKLPVKILPKLKKKNWHRVFFIIILLLISGNILFFGGRYYLRKFRKTSIKKTLNIQEAILEKIKKENTLKFMENKKDYLFFLLDQLKEYIYVTRHLKPSPDLLKTYEKFLSLESKLKFSKDNNLFAVKMYAKELENTLIRNLTITGESNVKY